MWASGICPMEATGVGSFRQMSRHPAFGGSHDDSTELRYGNSVKLAYIYSL